MYLSGCSANPADVIFVVDASGSIGAPNYDKLKAFVSACVRNLQVDNGMIRVAFVTFSDTYQSIFGLAAYTSRGPMLAAISAAPFIGAGTSVSAALAYVRTGIVGGADDRSTAPNLVVLITDGGSVDRQATSQEAARLRNTGAHIIVVGAGNWVYLPEIYAISGYPASSILLVNDLNNLNSSVPNLVAAICQSESRTFFYYIMMTYLKFISEFMQTCNLKDVIITIFSRFLQYHKIWGKQAISYVLS